MAMRNSAPEQITQRHLPRSETSRATLAIIRIVLRLYVTPSTGRGISLLGDAEGLTTKAAILSPKALQQALFESYQRDLFVFVFVIDQHDIANLEPSRLLQQAVYFAGKQSYPSAFRFQCLLTGKYLRKNQDFLFLIRRRIPTLFSRHFV